MALTKVSTGMLSADAASVDLNIDAGTMFIDASANRVGIGNTSPATALDVTGTVTADGGLIGDAVSGSLGQTGMLTVSDTNTTNTWTNFTGTAAYLPFEHELAVVNLADATTNSFAGLYFMAGETSAASGISSARIGAIRTGASTADLAFSTRGGGDMDEAMRIDSSGNVGIGTTSPSSVLHLSTSNDPKITLTDTGFGASADITGSNGNLRLNSQTATIFDMADSEVMRIDSSGNVGIGVTPDSWSSSSIALQLGSLALEDFTVSGANVSNILNNAYRNTSGNIVYKESDFASVYTQYNGEHKFQVAASGTAGNTITFTEAMRIDASGNVGIGTGSPSAKLDIFDSGAGNANSAAIELTNYDYGVGETGQSVSIESLVRNDGGGTSTTGKIVFGKDSDYSSAANRDGNIQFYTNQSNSVTEAMRIDSGGVLGLGNTPQNDWYSSVYSVMQIGEAGGIMSGKSDGNLYLCANAKYASDATWEYINGTERAFVLDMQDTIPLRFRYAASGTADTDITWSEAFRVDSSGNLLVGTTTTTAGNEGMVYFNGSSLRVTRDSDEPLNLDRLTSDGNIIQIRKDGSDVGSIGTTSSTLYIGGSSNGAIYFNGTTDVRPWNTSTQANLDNTMDLGGIAARWDDVYATNGTIQTSDRNEKQDIEALSDAEQRVAVAAKGLLRKFRWKSSVAESGDDARIHFGIIAQDLQAAFEAEGLDAGRYAMFINSTWTDEETGEERSRMGIRYSELLAFIIAAI